MIPSDRRPPMMDRNVRSLPIHIEDPNSVFTSYRFVEDIEVLGPYEADPRTFTRALCTIGKEVERFVFDGESELEEVHVEDRCTSWLLYDNGVEYQVEIFLDTQGFSTFFETISVLDDITRSEDSRLLLVADRPPSGSQKEYKEENEHIDFYPMVSAPNESLYRI